MPKLNQIIAIANGKKSQAKDALTQAYHQLQKPDFLSGIARNYKPKDEAGESQPPESKQVQVKVKEVIERVTRDLTELFDVVATQDWANTPGQGRRVGRRPRDAADVPVTHLLFLEKQLIDLNTFVEKLPTLDPGERWEFDTAPGLLRLGAVPNHEDQEGAQEPHQVRGHQGAPGPGGNVLRRT